MHYVAAPIKLNDGGVLGAISVAAPTTRMEEDMRKQVRDRVRQAANVIEITVTYS